MLRLLKSFFKPKEPPTTEAPYKVETPVVTPVMVPPEPAKCGCGRSSSGHCVGLHKLTQTEWDQHPDNPNKPVVKAQPAQKAPAKKKTSKPAAMKAPAKPRAPRKPKTK